MQGINYANEITNAYNNFYGILKGFSSLFDISTPKFIYYYVSNSLFEKMINTDELRFYTVDKHIKKDDKERRIKFDVEKKMQFSFVDNKSGIQFNVTELINKELSAENVFIKSCSYDDNNSYLWQKYANKNKGACFKINTNKFINLLNTSYLSFEDLPDMFKCCYVAYEDYTVFNHCLNNILKAIPTLPEQIKKSASIILPFYIDFLRTFVKHQSFVKEKEYRLVIADFYSLYLRILSVMYKWPNTVLFNGDREKISKAFYNEYIKVKSAFRDQFKFEKDKRGQYLKFPFIELLEGITLGSESIINIGELNNKLPNVKINKYN